MSYLTRVLGVFKTKKQLKKSIPVNTFNSEPESIPATPKDAFGEQYPHLHQALSPSTDGAWWCCKCYHESQVTLGPGNHPFDELMCPRCMHIICHDCQTTDIIQLTQDTLPSSVAVSIPTTEDLSHARVCPTCAKTHRGRLQQIRTRDSTTQWVAFETVCECGTVSSTQWLRFCIGSSQDWQESPLACYEKALEARIELIIARLATDKTPPPPCKRVPARKDSKIISMDLTGLPSPGSSIAESFIHEKMAYGTRRPVPKHKPPGYVNGGPYDGNFFEELRTSGTECTDCTVHERPRHALKRRGAIRGRPWDRLNE